MRAPSQTGFAKESNALEEIGSGGRIPIQAIPLKQRII